MQQNEQYVSNSAAQQHSNGSGTANQQHGNAA
jgi:hypothetical protein